VSDPGASGWPNPMEKMEDCVPVNAAAGAGHLHRENRTEDCHERQDRLQHQA
jgi:hypothetical protein